MGRRLKCKLKVSVSRVINRVASGSCISRRRFIFVTTLLCRLVSAPSTKYPTFKIERRAKLITTTRKGCHKAWVWLWINGQSPKQTQPHKNLTKMSTFTQKNKSSMTYKKKKNLPFPPPWAFQTESFSVHLWIGWWLALALMLNSPLHFLRMPPFKQKLSHQVFKLSSPPPKHVFDI